MNEFDVLSQSLEVSDWSVAADYCADQDDSVAETHWRRCHAIGMAWQALVAEKHPIPSLVESRFLITFGHTARRYYLRVTDTKQILWSNNPHWRTTVPVPFLRMTVNKRQFRDHFMPEEVARRIFKMASVLRWADIALLAPVVPDDGRLGNWLVQFVGLSVATSAEMDKKQLTVYSAGHTRAATMKLTRAMATVQLERSPFSYRHTYSPLGLLYALSEIGILPRIPTSV